MGKKDTITKEYMQEPETFADAFNFLLYGGKQVIKPEQLHELDTTLIVMPQEGTVISDFIQKYRDVVKTMSAMADTNTAYLILGIEEQSEIHYAMPVRNGMYDMMQYSKQISNIAAKHKKSHTEGVSNAEFLSGFYSNDRLVPVITLVMYFGTEEWGAPKSLHEMLSIQDEKILSFVPDYKINLIEPHAMDDDDFDKFNTELRSVLKYLKYAGDKTSLSKLMNEDEHFKNITPRTANLINTVTNSNLKIKNGEENIDMCKAIKEMIEDARRESEAAIKEEKRKAEEEKRRAEEANEKNITAIRRMLADNSFTHEKIAGLFDVPLEFIDDIANGITV